MSRSSRGLGHRPFTAATGVRIPYGMPKLDFQIIRMHMQGARWLLPRAGYVVYALFGFGQLMINWLLILGRMLV